MGNYLASFLSSLYILFLVKIDKYNWNKTKMKGVNRREQLFLSPFCYRVWGLVTL